MNAQKKPRGFAAMHPDHVKAISRKGGQAAHTAGTAHEFTSEEARIAGAKGGRATHAKKRALAPVGTKSGDVAKDPHRMVEVSCSSAAGCSGVAHADEAGGDMVGEIPTKKSKSHKVAAQTTAHDPRSGSPTQGPSADEDPDNMGSCGSGGCGSHG